MRLSLSRLIPPVRPLTLGLSLASLIGVRPSFAHADTPDIATAEALFQEGKALLAAKQYAAACSKLEDSHRIDPATGTLLALAFCHERAGRLATAWKEYGQVIARSEEAPERSSAAREKLTQIGASVSRLSIVPSERDTHRLGYSVQCDGAPVGSSKWGIALPVDGGVHVIEASIDGRVRWRLRVAVSPSGDSQTVHIPSLQETGAKETVEAGSPNLAGAPSREGTVPEHEVATATDRPGPLGAPGQADGDGVWNHGDSPVRPIPDAVERPSSGLSTWQVAGIAAMAAGTVGIGVGIGLSVRAVQKNAESRSGCDGDACDANGMQARLDARKAGDNATIAATAGAGLAGAGVLAFLFGRRKSPPSASARRIEVEAVTPIAIDHGWVGVVQGRF